MPTWFVVGVLMTFSDKFAEALGVSGKINPADSIMYTYIGIAVGDLVSGALSQLLRSRKKVILIFLTLNVIFIFLYLFVNGYSVFYFYLLCVMLGFSNGYWAVFVTNASEQFGTNFRATVTTSTPNIIRGTTVPLTLSFQYLSGPMGLIYAAMTVAIIDLAIAYYAAIRTAETFGKDLDYVEVT